MKKLFSLLTASVCMAMLTSAAFAADIDAYTVYRNSVKKLKSASSMELSKTIKLSDCSGSEIKELINQSSTVKVLITPGKTFHMAGKSAENGGAPTYRYLNETGFYERTGDSKIKINASGKQKPADMGELLDNDLYMSMPLMEEDFKDAKVEKVDGGTKITCKISSNFKNNYNNTTISSTRTINVTIGDDGILKSLSKTTVSGENGKVIHNAVETTRIKSVNSIKKIDFPSDLNTYKEFNFNNNK